MCNTEKIKTYNTGYVIRVYKKDHIVINLFLTFDVDRATTFCVKYNKLITKLKSFYRSRLEKMSNKDKYYSTLYFKYVRVDEIIGAAVEPIDIKW